MLISFNDNDAERKAKISTILPIVPFTDSIIIPALWRLMLQPLLQALIAEIEIYRAFPKRGKFDLEAFNPRNNKTCFMGLGFKANGDLTDAELAQYRKAVGTIPHNVWGNATLLEIWGGDHFEKHPAMVREVFKYAFHERKTMPKVQFFVMPLIITKDTGTMIYDDEQKEQFRRYQLAQENELRRSYGLPPQDYTTEEIETLRKEGKWSDKHSCPLDQIPKRGSKKPPRDDEDDE